MSNLVIKDIISQFAIYGEFLGARPFGNGHINDTFLSCWNQAGTEVRYTHQRINHNVFTHPDKVMDNILRVTNHIAGKNREAGIRDWNRRSLTVVPAKDGKPFARDVAGNWWRSYLFIENSHTRDTASTPEEAFLLGEETGLFQKQLADFPLPRLHDTILYFHNMEKRYLLFYEALKKDSRNRAGNAVLEIEFMRENEERGALFIRRERPLPERVCHNDTKMNNILLDNNDLKALCMIDLDTVMPGSSLFDLGDLIRTAANRAAEDERDISLVEFDIEFFKSLLKGYLSQAKHFLASDEISLLAESGRYITQIMGLRFLTDYLSGDQYYRVKRPDHNLDRCRTQIALINSMDRKWDAVLEAERMVYEQTENQNGVS